jgi:putative CocE/NonD family hydrolase
MGPAIPELPCPVEVIEPLRIPLSDGTRLAGKLWRPAGAGRHPAILEYLPYRYRDGTRTRDQGIHGYLAGHGYACLRVDIRGTGDSEGVLGDEYSDAELADGEALIAWIAAQPWCDGQVAMIGISWGGFNGLQIAARRPPALKTVITAGSTDDRYATDVHYIGGCLSKDNFDWSATMLAQNDLPPDPAVVGPAWRALWAERMEANAPWAHIWFRHQRRDGYWRHGSVCEDFAAIEVPVYAVSGWADNYSEAVPRLMAGLRGPRRGLIGPWAHSFPHDVTVGPAIGWLQEVRRWCDYWLKGRATGIMDEPLLRVWMQEGLPPRTCYDSRPGRWVAEEHWPSPRIAARALPLGAGGRFDGAAGQRTICSPLWVGLTAGEIGRYGGDADWPADQRIDDAGSLVWLSEPLPERLEILGAARLRLRVAADRAQALVAVRLCDVAPDGASARVTLGLLNLTHRDGHAAPRPLEPGRFIDVEVELDDIAHAFAPGQRIALALSSAYYPIAWPSPELASLTVDCAASTLILPVRPPRGEDATLRPFDPPEAAVQTPHRSLTAPATQRRRVSHDLLSGRMEVDFPRWTYAVTLEDIGQTVTSSGHVRHLVTDGDPLSAVTETRYEVTIARPDTTVGHRSSGRLSCDATHFLLETELAVTENGTEIFRRSWAERIARDHV